MSDRPTRFDVDDVMALLGDPDRPMLRAEAEVLERLRARYSDRLIEESSGVFPVDEILILSSTRNT